MIYTLVDSCTIYFRTHFNNNNKTSKTSLKRILVHTLYIIYHLSNSGMMDSTYAAYWPAAGSHKGVGTELIDYVIGC